ncbi:enoyl-CoA hydratase/carnithine racemase/carbon monoxide dehydrogenase subunit G [Massilia sp. UYP11]|uniref:enoyl-CoA hydratase-related protein n=1 Tax=Massilia sp. UYP11 TaxID=1756385 RepID=UPI003D1FEF78
MEMNDRIRLEASREAVWAALNDPEVLKASIPGCESLEKVSDTEFVSDVVVKVGPIRARFAGKVTLSDIVPLVSYRLTGEGQGGVAGFAKADIIVRLESEGPATTVLHYAVNANIGGKLAQLGSRMIDSTARKLADQFFASFNEAVLSQDSAPAAAPAVATATPMVADAAVSVSEAGPASSGARASGDAIVVTMVDVAEDAQFDALPEVPQLNPGIIARWLGLAPAQTTPAPAPAPAATGRYKAALVTLNRPAQKNAMSLAMWRDLGRIFTELGRDPEVRAILLTGAGGTFSAGADIAEFAKVRATVEQGVEYEKEVDRCCDAIAAVPKPTLAVINGFCMGGACNLAMSCDFRVAHSDAQFGIPAARLSIVYGVRGTRRLLNLVGAANAKRVLFGARKFGAREALRMGFAQRVSPDPMRAARSMAGVMAENAPLTIAGTKVLLDGLTMDMGTLSDELVDAVIDRAVASEDYRDARQAFVEKRQPVFAGK